MNRYKLELWKYENGARLVPTVIDNARQLAVCEMKCDGGSANPYAPTLAEAVNLASRIVEFLNTQAVED